MTKLDQLAEIGQSVWLDYLRRSFMEEGDLEGWVDQGLRGLTSNPSIFEKAIAGSDDYDDQLKALAREGKNDRQIYEALVFKDIQQACDLLRPVYEETEGLDGYVSLEASPSLARDTQGTIEEVKHFHREVNRPNLMIKIPATKEGYKAIEEMLSQGININITLMFSLEQYEAVAEAYMSGLERYAEAGGDVSQLASVASFFVSRVDTKVDQRLDEVGEESIRGEVGIANAKMAYQLFTETFSGDRWEALEQQGARVQRVLWGSTSTKDPAYPDTMYVDNLIGPHTINTLPPETLEAFIDHGTVARTLDKELDQARDTLKKLDQVGIDLDQVTDELLEEGLEKFADAFDGLMMAIEKEAGKYRQAESTTAGD
ncbi:MAG: transaldolase [Anaerolineales bacterium]